MTSNLENDSSRDIKELDIDELTEDEYSEKFYRPNFNRLQSENKDQIRDDNPKEHAQFGPQKDISKLTNSVPQENDVPKSTGVRFSIDNPSYVRDEEPAEQPAPTQENIPEISKYKPPMKDDITFTARTRPSRRCLWIIIVILSILLATMTGLFIWRMICYQNKEVQKTVFKNVETTQKPAVQTGCISLPSSIDLPTLPANIQKELQDFKTYLSEAVDKNQTVAVSANVVYRDKVIMEGAFGIMNKAEKPTRSPTVNTVYPCASLSKVLTALMWFKQVNDNKARSLIEDTVAQYEDKFDVNNPFNDNKITFWQLATQTSGLQREAPCYPSTATNLCPHDYNTMMNRTKNLTLLHAPGKIAQYSNFGFALLGQVLFEKFRKAGEPTFAKWMNDQLFLPLRMTNATFSLDEAQKANIPIGYLHDMTSWPIQDWGWLNPAGGMFASVNDLAKLQIELMSEKSNGRIISYQLAQEFFKPNYVFANDNMVGSSWEMSKTKKGYLLRAKDGYIYGYNGYMVMVPELRLGLNLLCTGCNQMLSAAGKSRFLRILDVFDKELTALSAKKISMPPNPKFFIGRYNSSIPEISSMEIKEKKLGENNILIVAVNGVVEYFYLDYTSPRTFRIKVNPLFGCLLKYIIGVENGMLIFDESPTPDGLSPRFTMFGAEPTGLSYFYRQ